MGNFLIQGILRKGSRKGRKGLVCNKKTEHGKCLGGLGVNTEVKGAEK